MKLGAVKTCTPIAIIAAAAASIQNSVLRYCRSPVVGLAGILILCTIQHLIARRKTGLPVIQNFLEERPQPLVFSREIKPAEQRLQSGCRPVFGGAAVLGMRDTVGVAGRA